MLWVNMEKMMKEAEKPMRSGDFAKKVGVTVQTLKNWDKNGTLVSKRTITGKRYYLQEDVDKVLRK